jgi:hypothetical protein
MRDPELSAAIEALLPDNGVSADALDLLPCVAGGNNRVYFVEGAGVPMVAKRYFRSPTDTRDRLRAEWSFISYAYSTGLHCVPRPIAADPAGQLALYERVEGRKLAAGEVAESDVRAAAEFIRQLNAPIRRPHAVGLPQASEAGFSVAEHFAVIDRRLARLATATAKAVNDDGSNEFVRQLRDYWGGLKDLIADQAASARFALDDILPEELRWISPSDFGFHNVLKRPDDSLCFIDFEYAGWDDPAKTVADFFLQPQVPVDARYVDGFLEQTLDAAGSRPQRRRIEILRPIFAVKWCIIMMNPFVAERAQAGTFADPARDQTERRQTQLAKATAALRAMKLDQQEWHM